MHLYKISDAWICSCCQLDFPTRWQAKECCPPIESFGCDLCNKIFAQFESAVDHLELEHLDEDLQIALTQAELEAAGQERLFV